MKVARNGVTKPLANSQRRLGLRKFQNSIVQGFFFYFSSIFLIFQPLISHIYTCQKILNFLWCFLVSIRDLTTHNFFFEKRDNTMSVLAKQPTWWDNTISVLAKQPTWWDNTTSVLSKQLTWWDNTTLVLAKQPTWCCPPCYVVYH